MSIKKTKRNYDELSALIDADSFFYGLHEKGKLDKIDRVDLDQLSELSFDVNHFKAGVRSESYVHLPKEQFQETRRKSYLKSIKAFHRLKQPSIFVDDINKDICTIWAIEKSDLAMLSSLTPKPILYHYSTAMIKLALAQNCDGVFANFKEQILDVVVIKNGVFHGYNRSAFYSISDVLYFILLAYHNTDISTLKEPLFVMGDIEKDDEKYNAIIDYIQKFSFIESAKTFPLKDNLNYHQIAPLHAISLCG